jgi:acyl-CoA synthetase (AMP-forming)/AMP-acid ligase II
MVSHANVIANVLQLATFEKPQRRPSQKNVVLGLLPQSHIYGLVVVCHASIYRGDSVVVLPKFEISLLATAIATFRINLLYIVSSLNALIFHSKILTRQHLGSADCDIDHQQQIRAR